MKKFCYLLIILISITACDILSPKKSFRIAIPENDYTYNTSAQHLKSFLEDGGFSVKIIKTENAIEANHLVAKGEADLTFIMNHSDFIPEKLGTEAGKLRTICPMFRRYMFLFSRYPVNDSLEARVLIEGKSIGIEVMEGETHQNLKFMMKSGKMDNVSIIQNDNDSDFKHFWGTIYGKRASQLKEEGWEEISFNPSWINFTTINDPALDGYLIPAIPGVEDAKDINTISTETLLVGNNELGENAIFDLSKYIYQHKTDLMKYDLMYRSISEKVDATTLLYPFHEGTVSYFRRNQPSFIIKYLDRLALIFSLSAVIFGAFQAIRNKIRNRKKERIDLYFMNFLDIRSSEAEKEEKVKQLDELLQRALVQMTSEKLEITDFHIFSRLVQQELNNLKV